MNPPPPLYQSYEKQPNPKMNRDSIIKKDQLPALKNETVDLSNLDQ